MKKQKKSSEWLKLTAIATVFLKHKPVTSVEIGIYIDRNWEGDVLRVALISAYETATIKAANEAGKFIAGVGPSIAEDLKKGIARVTVEYKVRIVEKYRMSNRVKFVQPKPERPRMIKIPGMRGRPH